MTPEIYNDKKSLVECGVCKAFYEQLLQYYEIPVNMKTVTSKLCEIFGLSSLSGRI